MFKNLTYKVTEAIAPERLDRVLQCLTALSRKKVKAQLDRGRVKLNGRKVVIASWIANPGDRIELLPEETEATETVPDAKPYYLKVVYEDPNLLVIEKDSGIPCEPSTISTRPSIVAIINAYLKRKYPHLKHHYLGLVHRLDRETSGLMVYSKTREANQITDQFKRHSIERRYLAIVQGRIEGEGGKVEGFLKKSALLKGGKKVAIGTEASGRHAVTHYRVKERYAGATLIEVKLNTGRTHQIRVQMDSIGHPILGDKIYGRTIFSDKEPALPGRSRSGGGLGGGREAPPRFNRQALHASFLSFHHPVTHKKMEFKSELPKDLRRLVDHLRLAG